jgi:single-strand DNA-binding protein
MYMNQLTIIGFTGQDAEFHYTPQPHSCCDDLGRDQGIVEERARRVAEPHRMAPRCGRKLGEYAKTLAKGSHVLVQGALRSREYEKDGVKHRVVELRADSIGKLDRAVRREQGEPHSEEA